MPKADNPNYGDPLPLPERDELVAQLNAAWKAIRAELPKGSDELSQSMNKLLAGLGYDNAVVLYFLKRLRLVRWVPKSRTWKINVGGKVDITVIDSLLEAGDVPRVWLGRDRKTPPADPKADAAGARKGKSGAGAANARKTPTKKADAAKAPRNKANAAETPEQELERLRAENTDLRRRLAGAAQALNGFRF